MPKDQKDKDNSEVLPSPTLLHPDKLLETEKEKNLIDDYARKHMDPISFFAWERLPITSNDKVALFKELMTQPNNPKKQN